MSNEVEVLNRNPLIKGNNKVSFGHGPLFFLPPLRQLSKWLHEERPRARIKTVEPPGHSIFTIGFPSIGPICIAYTARAHPHQNFREVSGGKLLFE